MKHHAGFAAFKSLLFIRSGKDGKEHTVNANRGFDDVGSVRLVEFGVEVLDFLARIFLMLREVEVGTGVDSLHFLETERHFKFDVGGGISVMGKFVVVMETIFVVAETESLVPTKTCLFPVFEPFEFFTRANKELHFHLFELAHAEDELTGYDFVTESLAYLCDTERNAHAAGFLNVEVVDEDSLRRFGAKVNRHRTVGR